MSASETLDSVMRTAAREVSLTQMRSLSVRMDDDDGDDGETGVAGSAPAPDAAARAKRDVLLEVLGSPTARAGRQKRIARWRFRDVFRLWRLAFKGDCRQDAIFGVVVVANVIAQVISLSLPVYSGQIISELTGGDTHGEAANGDRLAHQLAEAIGVILVYVLLSCSASVVLMLTGISWRAALTSELQRLYMLAGRSLAFHKVQLFDCDNPDQRIAADTANFTKLCCGGVAPPLSSVISQLIQSLSLAIAATVVSVKRAGWRITLISYAYNILTILLNVAISLPIAASTAAQGAHEGNFRRAHVRLQTYAESIALYGAQGAEHAQLEARLTPVIVNQRKLTLEYFRLIVSITFSGVGGGLIGLMIAAVSVWSGERKVYSIAELSEVLGTLDLLSAALQALPALLPEIATIAGLSKRVIDLHRTLDTINNAPPPAVEPSDSLDSFGCADLSFSIPDGTRTLARALSFKVSGPGGSVLIVGESGCGKSSLLRCLVGMWDADAGAIFRPRGASVRGGVFLLPQKPYMCVGTLRMQVCFPLLPEADEALGRAQDVRILELLDAVALGEAATQFGLDSSLAWEDVLSVGEQQRLSFARLLFHAPRFAALDEATSALDLEIEARCMQLVVDAGIALLSVAHRPSVARFHQFVLRLRRDGTHELTPIEPAHGIEATFLTPHVADHAAHGADNVVYARASSTSLSPSSAPMWSGQGLFTPSPSATNRERPWRASKQPLRASPSARASVMGHELATREAHLGMKPLALWHDDAVPTFELVPGLRAEHPGRSPSLQLSAHGQTPPQPTVTRRKLMLPSPNEEARMVEETKAQARKDRLLSVRRREAELAAEIRDRYKQHVALESDAQAAHDEAERAAAERRRLEDLEAHAAELRAQLGEAHRAAERERAEAAYRAAVGAEEAEAKRAAELERYARARETLDANERGRNARVTSAAANRATALEAEAARTARAVSAQRARAALAASEAESSHARRNATRPRAQAHSALDEPVDAELIERAMSGRCEASAKPTDFAKTRFHCAATPLAAPPPPHAQPAAETNGGSERRHAWAVERPTQPVRSEPSLTPRLSSRFDDERDESARALPPPRSSVRGTRASRSPDGNARFGLAQSSGLSPTAPRLERLARQLDAAADGGASVLQQSATASAERWRARKAASGSPVQPKSEASALTHASSQPQLQPWWAQVHTAAQHNARAQPPTAAALSCAALPAAAYWQPADDDAQGVDRPSATELELRALLDELGTDEEEMASERDAGKPRAATRGALDRAAVSQSSGADVFDQLFASVGLVGAARSPGALDAVGARDAEASKPSARIAGSARFVPRYARPEAPAAGPGEPAVVARLSLREALFALQHDAVQQERDLPRLVDEAALAAAAWAEAAAQPAAEAAAEAVEADSEAVAALRLSLSAPLEQLLSTAAAWGRDETPAALPRAERERVARRALSTESEVLASVETAGLRPLISLGPLGAEESSLDDELELIETELRYSLDSAAAQQAASPSRARPLPSSPASLETRAWQVRQGAPGLMTQHLVAFSNLAEATHVLHQERLSFSPRTASPLGARSVRTDLASPLTPRQRPSEEGAEHGASGALDRGSMPHSRAHRALASPADAPADRADEPPPSCSPRSRGRRHAAASPPDSPAPAAHAHAADAAPIAHARAAADDARAHGLRAQSAERARLASLGETIRSVKASMRDLQELAHALPHAPQPQPPRLETPAAAAPQQPPQPQTLAAAASREPPAGKARATVSSRLLRLHKPASRATNELRGSGGSAHRAAAARTEPPAAASLRLSATGGVGGSRGLAQGRVAGLVAKFQIQTDQPHAPPTAAEAEAPLARALLSTTQAEAAHSSPAPAAGACVAGVATSLTSATLSALKLRLQAHALADAPGPSTSPAGARAHEHGEVLPTPLARRPPASPPSVVAKASSHFHFVSEFVASAVVPAVVTDALERHMRAAASSAESARSPTHSALARVRRREAFGGGRQLLADFDQASELPEPSDGAAGEGADALRSPHAPPLSPASLSVDVASSWDDDTESIEVVDHDQDDDDAEAPAREPSESPARELQLLVAPAVSRALGDRYVAANTAAIVSAGLASALAASRAHGGADDDSDDDTELRGAPARAPSRPLVSPAFARALRDRYVSASTPEAVKEGFAHALEASRAAFTSAAPNATAGESAARCELEPSAARSEPPPRGALPLISPLAARAIARRLESSRAHSAAATTSGAVQASGGLLAQVIASNPPRVSARARSRSPLTIREDSAEGADDAGSTAGSPLAESARHDTGGEARESAAERLTRHAAVLDLTDVAADADQLERRRAELAARAEQRRAQADLRLGAVTRKAAAIQPRQRTPGWLAATARASHAAGAQTVTTTSLAPTRAPQEHAPSTIKAPGKPANSAREAQERKQRRQWATSRPPPPRATASASPNVRIL